MLLPEHRCSWLDADVTLHVLHMNIDGAGQMLMSSYMSIDGAGRLPMSSYMNIDGAGWMPMSSCVFRNCTKDAN